MLKQCGVFYVGEKQELSFDQKFNIKTKENSRFFSKKLLQIFDLQ